MKTQSSNLGLIVVLEQVTNISTSGRNCYFGNKLGEFAGQIFTSPADGELSNIEILPSLVNENGPVELTIHSIDPINRSWSRVLGKTCIEISSNDIYNWISFPLADLHVRLKKGINYGFRLQSNTIMGGTPENFPSDHSKIFFSYLSLAFKSPIRA